MSFFEKFLTTILRYVVLFSFFLSLYNFLWGKKQLKEQNRSYLKIRSKFDHLGNSQQNTLILDLEIENTGKVPAYNVRLVDFRIKGDLIKKFNKKKIVKIIPNGIERITILTEFKIEDFMIESKIYIPMKFILEHGDIYKKKYSESHIINHEQQIPYAGVW